METSAVGVAITSFLFSLPTKVLAGFSWNVFGKIKGNFLIVSFLTLMVIFWDCVLFSCLGVSYILMVVLTGKLDWTWIELFGMDIILAWVVAKLGVTTVTDVVIE